VSKQSAQDRYVTAITVVSCSSRHASLGNWSTGERRTYDLLDRTPHLDLSCACDMLKRLNGSTFCFGYRLLGTQGTLYQMGDPIPLQRRQWDPTRPSQNYFGHLWSVFRFEIIARPISTTKHIKPQIIHYNSQRQLHRVSTQSVPRTPRS